MREIGIMLLAMGACIFLIGLNLDTTVATTYGDSRVHNIGLMNDRQAFIIFAAALAVIGAIFVGRSGSNEQLQINQEGLSSPRADTHKCPFCAESIKSEAIICRFCQKNLPLIPETTASADASSTPEPPVKVGAWNYVAIGVALAMLLFGVISEAFGHGSFHILAVLPGVIIWGTVILYCLINHSDGKKK